MLGLVGPVVAAHSAKRSSQSHVHSSAAQTQLKLLGYTTILIIIHTERQNSLLTDLQDCTTMLTIIHTWNSLLTKLPGEHQPSLPAQRAQVLPEQGKKQSNKTK